MAYSGVKVRLRLRFPFSCMVWHTGHFYDEMIEFIKVKQHGRVEPSDGDGLIQSMEPDFWNIQLDGGQRGCVGLHAGQLNL